MFAHRGEHRAVSIACERFSAATSCGWFAGAARERGRKADQNLIADERKPGPRSVSQLARDQYLVARGGARSNQRERHTTRAVAPPASAASTFIGIRP
jgi:hypothetical protein